MPYIRCFYFGFKTAAGIGKNAKPTHELEFIFMAFLWLQGELTVLESMTVYSPTLKPDDSQWMDHSDKR